MKIMPVNIRNNCTSSGDIKTLPPGVAGVFFAEATTGFEPVIRVLQTLALPLGHVAMRDILFYCN
jgi:hypothetical protein